MSHEASTTVRQQSSLWNRVHQLINARQDRRRQDGDRTRERWLYETRNAAEERRRLPHLFAQARQGALPTTFQYCSQSAPEPIPAQGLRCALGVDVAACPILKDLVEPLRAEFPPELLDTLQAEICVSHIFTRCIEAGHMVHDNTGYIQDASDRMYWDRLHSNLAAMTDAPDEEPNP